MSTAFDALVVPLERLIQLPCLCRTESGEDPSPSSPRMESDRALVTNVLEAVPGGSCRSRRGGEFGSTWSSSMLLSVFSISILRLHECPGRGRSGESKAPESNPETSSNWGNVGGRDDLTGVEDDGDEG